MEKPLGVRIRPTPNHRNRMTGSAKLRRRTPATLCAYPAAVIDRHAEDWEELAQREPYFAVLTNEGLLGAAGNPVATAAFFETGEADVASLLEAIAAVLRREVPLSTVLDFGCGVGRLTLPLARRATVRVVGCDVAPTMLLHARENAQKSGLQNVTFIETPQLTELSESQFDFICSLLVFQHIPPSVGHPLIRTLLGLLGAGGVAALHVTFARPGGGLRRLGRTIRGRSRLVHRTIGTLRGDALRLPYMQMNEYDVAAIERDAESAGARVVARFPTQHGDAAGAVLLIEKPA
jgi:SAM-dependent methyltransferase